MIYPIVKDIEILKTVSKPALPEDVDIIPDMINTAKSHPTCVGLAAIQVGIPLRIILVYMYDRFVPMINPVIARKYGTKYTAEEGCLSLDGTRTVKRFMNIDVVYSPLDNPTKRIRASYGTLIAEIIQHECDHLDGKLI